MWYRTFLPSPLTRNLLNYWPLWVKALYFHYLFRRVKDLHWNPHPQSTVDQSFAPIGWRCEGKKRKTPDTRARRTGWCVPQFTRRLHMAYGHNHSSPDDARRTPATTENDVPPKLSMLGTRCGGLLQTKGLRAFQIDVGQRFVAHGLSSLKPLRWGTAASSNHATQANKN